VKEPSSTPWAVINPEDLLVSIVATPPRAKLAVPMDRVRHADERADYQGIFAPVYFGTIYTLHAETQPPDDRKKYSLIAPDPWMLAVAAVVWEGLLQGLSWDLVKAAAISVLGTLRQQRLAPRTEVATKRQSKSGTVSVGFHYERYSEGEGLERFLLGLRHTYERSSEIERIQAVRPAEYERLRQERFKKEGR
jgi:hypothetical protein